jgi:ABC-type transport system involved in cytochrome bd biosynthesis fused ATPase/permease subunit
MVPLLMIFAWAQWNRSAMIDHSRSLTAIATSHVMGRKNDLIEGREIFLLYDRAEHLLRRMADSFRNYLQASALTAQIEIWASFWVRVSSETFSFGVLLLMTLAISGRLEQRWPESLSLPCLESPGAWRGSFAPAGLQVQPTCAASLNRRPAPEEIEEAKHPNSRLSNLRTAISVRTHDVLSPGHSDNPWNLNLMLPAGSKTALIGRTGSGKPA